MRITRFLRIALALVVTGCGAAKTTAAPPHLVQPPRDFGMSSHSIETERNDAPRAMWAVRTFDEKQGWLASQAKLSTTEGMWGERMAAAVSRQLDARRVNSTVIPKDV